MVLEFLQAHLDFVAFIAGGAWALCARACLGTARLKHQRSWYWLGLFAATQALACWTEIGRYNHSAAALMDTLALPILLASLACLLEYGRTVLFSATGRKPGVWIHGAALALVLPGFALASHLDEWIWRTQGWLATGVAAGGMLVAARSDSHRADAWSMRAMALALVGYDAAFALLAHPHSAHSSNVLVLVLPLIVLLQLAMETVFTRYHLQALKHFVNLGTRFRTAMQVLAVPTLLVCTWLAAEQAGKWRDAAMRDDVMMRAHLVAGALSADDYSPLAWSDADLASAHYQHLKSQLMSLVHANNDLRFVLLAGYRDGKSVFVADSESPESPDYSPPGQPYDEAAPDYLAGMAAREPFILGPVEDRWGTWIIASVPLPTPAGAQPVNAEIDIAAQNWDADVRAARVPVLLIAALIALLLISYSHGQANDLESLSRVVSAKEAAEAAARAKSDFLAVMSHEIRTPLGSVIGMLELMQRTRDEGERKRQLTLARGSAETLLHILDDILDASKVESGKLLLENVSFVLREQMSYVLEAMRVRAEAKGITLTWFMANDLPATVIGDPTRIKQVLANLLNNAIKFTSEGGVSVSFGVEAASTEALTLLLRVTDTGIGIEPDVLPRLFEKFVQADASTTRHFGGTGLGLAIIKGLIDRMGGSVGVESVPGKGTTFTVRIPLKWDPTVLHTDDDVSAEAATAIAGLRLLCAEDDAVNREYLRTLLASLGLVAVFAENGREAIELLRRQRFDAVLMDNRMPVMDGFQATRAIRDPASGVLDPAIPVVAVTANASANYRNECLAAGMNDFLTKPLRRHELVPVLVRLAQPQPLAPVPEEAPLVGLSEAELLAMLDEDDAANTAADAVVLLPNVVQIYLQETPKRLQEMRAALKLGDYLTLGRAAHTIKGSSRHVAAETLAELGATIERCAEANDIAGMVELIDAADAEFAALAAQLQTTLAMTLKEVA